MPKKLQPKQRAVFDFVRTNHGVTNQEIVEALSPQFGELHRNTITGYLNELLDAGLIKKIGAGGFDVRYIEIIPHIGYQYFDVEKYFLKEADEREARTNFNPDVFALLRDTFTKYELAKVSALNARYRETIASFTPPQRRRELERFTIELAWKSSRIEGNTYSLLDTESLIKRHQEAAGHEKKEAVEILNHKKAIDYILENPQVFQDINVKKIVELHSLLTQGLDIEPDIRDKSVGITGTKYRPLGSQVEIDAAMRNLVELVNYIKEPIEKAFVVVLMISYIQPFFDGNKRTARILGNAILLAHETAPLSYRSVDETEYKKGMLLFYEQNSFRYFKELFIEQFKFSVNNYFSMGTPN